MDFYEFYMGNEFEAYRYLGAHFAGGTTTFRTFAPKASKISVIGEFNGWVETPMNKVYDGNFWECVIPHTQEGQMYKYRIYKADGTYIDHCDPYAFYSELRPGNASRIARLDISVFHDKRWLNGRGGHCDKPVNIYEIHFGSWKRKDNDEPYSYAELAEVLIPYLKENGYNYVELMPLNEYPADASWGYQATGFFSPTSRYGTPDELRAFVNECHKSKIGVIMDFVPVHFAVDDYALWNYDGTALYEYPHVDVGYSEWGSCNFMHSRGEVRSFLQSAAYYWLREFHIDGLRFDAVSNMLYWQGNKERGENKSAIEFIKSLNSGLKERFPDVMLIAEDSSAFPNVTKAVSEGGLGFDYKWDMGWMNDTLDYFRLAPQDRTAQYHKLTFSMMYFHSERFILPFSHDENVHGKATIIQKMNGDYEQKFPQARALYLYMYAHPGKKLNFMGGEFAQFREWDETREQDFDILRYPIHDAFYHYMQELNHIYLNNSALWNDYSNDGFEWIDCHLERKCVYSFLRRSKGQSMIAVFNFSDSYTDYALKLDDTKMLTLLIDTDEQRFGGNTIPDKTITVKNESAILSLPPFSGRLYKA
ncbi:1,4-alpha-glucan branching protein GlgB [Ruminococcus sp.]|uniref:1,4-alpha-glucan branching protein GlgB n=1 Tax=Ruminococcus sp. TaxID=41978 RepID=UPI0025E9E660|nr:1,4-alpha-glucan branching protein GlgB [Ruminococcus sp.]MBQ8965435.1 1,4-alpha-glucan branching protein GlgB [Ruminococcus sp.]